MIKVLWIDDECKDNHDNLSEMGREFIEYAYEQGIEITPISTYEEGITAIESSPLEWSAVILDIREQKATTGNAVDGYQNAYDWLHAFHIERHQQEPYVFTLSGEKRYQEQDSLIRNESYCSKRVYDKNRGDYKILFDDIRRIKNISSLFKLHEEYFDVLNISKSLGGNAKDRLLEIMYPILIRKDTTNPKILNEIRKYLEDVINPFLEKIISFPDGKKSSHQYLNYLKKVQKQKDNPISIYIPKYLTFSFHNLLNIVNEGSHGGNKVDVDKDIRNGNAPYLLQSCLFELLNVIYWTKFVSQ